VKGILVSREKEEVAKSALLLSMESTVCRKVIEAMCETALFRCLLEVYLEIALAFHVIQQIERCPREIEV